jgi:RNA polymerase sigma-70 factor (ECF subfamily)|nr:sigma-70 family RNA polymerase sigma factor [Kofleriaceae bacterium]
MPKPDAATLLAEAAERDADADLEACRRGDRGAQERVLRAHAPMLARLIGRLVRDRAEAEDLLQSTFAGALVGFERFRGDASVATWLSQIAMRRVQDHWRRRARRPEVVGDHDVASEARLDAQAEARRRLARLEVHLDAIGATKRLAFVLHVVEGRPVAEVASMMSASAVTTRSRVMWARRALIARLRKDPALADLVEDL